MACSIPVFRYALEHWPPDVYTAVVFHDMPLSDTQKKWVNQLDASPSPKELKPVKTYTVRLHFSEPEMLVDGDRTFDVHLQGKLAIKALDIVKEAGGHRQTLVKEFKGIQVEEALEIQLIASEKQKHGTLLSGIELLAE